MPCQKHPLASAACAHCPVCLLEQALVPSAARQLTVHVPLGYGPDTAVFIVRQDVPAPALLRLKVWRRRAPAGFLEGVSTLIEDLQEHGEPAVVAPIAGWVDEAGYPAVLSRFRLGVPILSAVKSGALPSDAALVLLESLVPVLDRCHRRGLAHGSIVPGNVLVEPDARALLLVDFGLSRLAGPTAQADPVTGDRDGLASLQQTLRHS
jgi:hypothetical protein